jgi:hypothetical protein
VSLADELNEHLAAARAHRANVERADELALRNAAHEAGLPLQKRPRLTRLFLDQYDGPVDPDHLVAAWYRTVEDREPPADVTERLAEADAEARIARFRAALDSPHQEATR